MRAATQDSRSSRLLTTSLLVIFATQLGSCLTSQLCSCSMPRASRVACQRTWLEDALALANGLHLCLKPAVQLCLGLRNAACGAPGKTVCILQTCSKGSSRCY